jgi:hypothetical protein
LKKTAVIAAAFALALRGEVVDRIAATVGNSVVMRSEAIVQTRVAAFLNEKPASLTPASLREAVDRLVEQALIRREIESGDYAAADPDAGQLLADQIREQRFAGQNAAFEAALRAYGITVVELRQQLQWQASVVRFVEQRFRAGAQVPSEDIASYYNEKFLPQWRRSSEGVPPPLENVEDEIEERLSQEQTARLLDRWLSLTRTQTEIRYRDGALEGVIP